MRILMAIVFVATVAGSPGDSFGMQGGAKRRGGEGGTSTHSVRTFASREYSAQPISSVPEPGTIVLLVSGAAGLVLWARRRR